ncbi:MAG: HEAT repeat domain-containing protein, partial [Dehalococcoidales bacterium]|nr:HEAT repeat domain-containing protein [Dehalococcoidales bacterium]
PTMPYPIHDHGAWGVVGGFANNTQAIVYRRLDDGSVEGHAQLQEVSRQVIKPGYATHVFPFSIHHMSSANDKASLTLHVYGRPVRKGLINIFNIADNSVSEILTPKLDKRWHAIQALGAIGGNHAKALIEKAFHDAHPRLRWTSLETMREVDEDGYKDLLKEALNDSDEQIRAKAKALLEKM